MWVPVRIEITASTFAIADRPFNLHQAVRPLIWSVSVIVISRQSLDQDGVGGVQG
jgi:hypothetical protein